MATNLARNCRLVEPILLWNRNLDKALDCANKVRGVQVIGTLEDAVSAADIIWTCFSTESAVTEIYETVLDKPRSKKLFLECSTIGTKATNRLAERAIANGAEFVAMPVFGDLRRAEKGLLTCVPAGHADSVRKVIPFLKGVIASAVIDRSDQEPGTASHFKLIGNVVIMQLIESAAEAHLLAEKTGMKAENVQQLFDVVWPGALSFYSERMRSGGYYTEQPMVHIDMANHVADHVLKLAESVDASLPAYRICCEDFKRVQEYKRPYRDITVIHGALREDSNLDYERR